jgi:hypothetical protein
MAVSDTARLDVVLRCPSMPLLQLLLAATGVVTLIVICHRRGFRGDSPGMDLHSTPAMGADGTLSPKRDWYRTVRRYGETYEPNPSRQCEPMSITMCWIGLARKVSQNQTEPFLRRTRWGARLSHTWCEPCLLAMEAKILPARAVRTACGGIVESAPESGSSSVPTPSERESHRTSRYFRVGITFPLAFCLTDRSTISDESPIDWTTVGASKPVPATVRSGMDWLPTLKEGGQRNL